MRISDWSSDVCSSDLLRRGGLADPEPDCDHHRLRRAQQGARRRLGRRRRFLAAGDHRREYRPPLHLEPVAKPAMTDPHRKTTSRRRLLRPAVLAMAVVLRSEEHTSELQSLMRNSYAVFCLKKKKEHHTTH